MLGTFTSKPSRMTPRNRMQKRDFFATFWPKFKRFALIPMIVLLLFIIVLQILHHIFFPITKVEVIDSVGNVDQTALQSVVSTDVQKGFFHLNLAGIKKDVLTLPWVKDAQVVREWPDGIQIDIIERKPIAFWDTDSLVDAQGTIFTPTNKNTLPQQLPMFSGSADALSVMLQNYSLFNQILGTKDLSVSAIHVSQRMSWSIIDNQGTEIILGRKKIQQRLHRFVQIYDTIFASTNVRAQSVDMRYPNAMAVHWQQS